MSSMVQSPGALLPKRRSLARVLDATLCAEIVTDWTEARPRWARLSTRCEAMPFQRTAWLDPWFKHHAGRGVSPLIVFVQDRDTGRDLAALPLILFRRGLLRIIAFADRGLTDYNAPLVAADGSADTIEPATFWAVVRAVLPPADLTEFEKMPCRIGGRGNPLTALPEATASSLTGNVVEMPDCWEAWQARFNRVARKELARAARVFERHEGAAYRRYAAGAEAARIYAALKTLQTGRIRELGLPYVLDDEPARGFYDDIAAEGLRDGTTVLTALTIGDEVVAALLGITDGPQVSIMRLATPGPQWKHFSPGRLLIERTMRDLHEQGVRIFDFTIGNYDYKRRLGAAPLPLADLNVALSPLGWPHAARCRARVLLARYPRFERAARRMTGRLREPHALRCAGSTPVPRLS